MFFQHILTKNSTTKKSTGTVSKKAFNDRIGICIFDESRNFISFRTLRIYRPKKEILLEIFIEI